MAVVFLGGAVACSSSKSGAGDAGGVGGTHVGGSSGSGGGGAGGMGGTGGTGAAGGAPMDANPASMPPKSCRDIRNCVEACDADKACAMRCVSTAPTAAQSLYQMVTMCSAQACPKQDMSCRCDQECFGGGACMDVVDQCNNSAEPDNFCDPMGAKCGL
jgi:hypothetical protein